MLRSPESPLSKKGKYSSWNNCFDLPGALCSFEDEIHAQNFNIHDINEVIIQTFTSE